MKEFFEVMEKVPPGAQLLLLIWMVWDMRKRVIRNSKSTRTLVALNLVMAKTLDVPEDAAKHLPADDDEGSED